MSDKGLEEWKYRKIYEREGVLTKGSGENKIEGTIEDFEKLGKKNKWEKYGHNNEGKGFLGKILKLKPDSVLDVGCGYNEFVRSLRSDPLFKGKKKSVIGVDIACPGADHTAPAHNMPMFSDKQFDLVVSFDCFEHIPEAEVEGAFKEINRVGNRIFIQIALENSPTKVDGSPVHVCIKPKEWWEEIASKYFTLDVSRVDGTACFDPAVGSVVYNDRDTKARALILVGHSRDGQEA